MSYWAAPKDEIYLLEERGKLKQNSNSSEEKDITDYLKIPLMNSILLYSTIGMSSSLQKPDLVDKIQNHYLSKLHRYLKYIYGENEATEYLAEGMKIASMAREAQDIWSYRLPV